LSSILIRQGALVAIVYGVVYLSQLLAWPQVGNMRDTGLSPWDDYIGVDFSTGWDDYIVVGFTVLLALGVVLPIAALHALQRGHYGLPGTLASLLVFVGVAIIFVGVHNVSTMLPLIVGWLVVSVGLIALGIVTITARVLPWWCGAALIVSPICSVLGPLVGAPVLGPLGGVPWVLVGVAIFRAAGGRTERPSRVR